jgi:hypothetical protein
VTRHQYDTYCFAVRTFRCFSFGLSIFFWVVLVGGGGVCADESWCYSIFFIILSALCVLQQQQQQQGREPGEQQGARVASELRDGQVLQ